MTRLSIPLRVFLIVPFVLLTSGAAGIVGYLSWRNGQQAVHHLAQQMINEVSDRVVLRLDTYLATPHLINQLNQDALETQQLDPDDFLQLEHHFWRQMQRFPFIHQISLGNEQGNVVGVIRPRDTQDLEVIVTDQFPRRVYYSLDAKGNRIQRLRDDPFFDPRVRPWYQAAVQEKQANWSQIYPFFSDGELGISAVMPLQQKGRIQGVLEANFSLHLISTFLHDLKVSRSGQVFIMEQNNNLVAASTIELPFSKRLHNQAQRIKAINSSNPIIQQVAQQLQSQMNTLQKPTQFELTVLQKRQFVQVVPYQDPYGLNWLIVVTVPEADFMQQINENTRTSGILSLIALASAIILGFALAYWMTRPIQQLSRASRVLADGNWQLKLPENTLITELQVLTHSFNQTATQLQRSFDQVKTALQKSEEKFTKVFRSSPDPIVIVTPEGAYLEMNEAFVDLLGYSRQDLLENTIDALGIWTDSADYKHYVQQVQATGRVQNLEYTLQSRFERSLRVLLSAEQIDIQGQPCMIVILKDITERHEIERMKHEFISIVSHELRTPLTAIRGFLGLLGTGLYDQKPEKAKRMIDLALTSSDRLVRLINDILDLERLDSGKAPLVMEYADSAMLVQKAIEGIQAIADESTITFLVAAASAQVWVAPDAMIQTLTNLVSNAIKFSPPGETVWISVRLSGNHLLFSVRDHGRGIPADKLETIFERFQQVDASDARQKGGTGLGLAICRSIVQQHGGQIWAESILGKGSTFYFRLPLLLEMPYDQTDSCR